MSYRSYRSDNITPVLGIIIVCFLVFIVEKAVPLFGSGLPNQMNPVVEILGLQTATFLQHPWTIITNLFVHDPTGTIPWHLLFNMITLYFFGTFLIKLIGTRDFLIIYFLGGIAGNIVFMLFAFTGFFTSPFSIVIGASGAIFALGGTLALLTPRLRVFVFPIPVPMPLWVAVIGGFVILVFIGGVAWQGHLGGLVFGLLAGLVLRRRIRTPFS
jgi:membrane associated rhomboid family serine protease